MLFIGVFRWTFGKSHRKNLVEFDIKIWKTFILVKIGSYMTIPRYRPFSMNVLMYKTVTWFDLKMTANKQWPFKLTKLSITWDTLMQSTWCGGHHTPRAVILSLTQALVLLIAPSVTKVTPTVPRSDSQFYHNAIQNWPKRSNIKGVGKVNPYKEFSQSKIWCLIINFGFE